MSETVQTAILALIEHYVERQKIVYDLLHKLRPDLVVLAKCSDASLDWFEQFKQLAESARTVPQKGYWGESQEWEYFIHGGGCRIVHVATGEPIDWNLPDVNRLDKYAFLNYLAWRIAQNVADSSNSVLKNMLETTTLEDLVFAVLENLKLNGYLLNSDASNCYRIVQS